jgi:hypothetical protein
MRSTTHQPAALAVLKAILTRRATVLSVGEWHFYSPNCSPIKMIRFWLADAHLERAGSFAICIGLAMWRKAATSQRQQLRDCAPINGFGRICRRQGKKWIPPRSSFRPLRIIAAPRRMRCFRDLHNAFEAFNLRNFVSGYRVWVAGSEQNQQLGFHGADGWCISAE